MEEFTTTKTLIHCPNCGKDFYCYEFPAEEGGELFLLFDETEVEGEKVSNEIGWWYCACFDCGFFIKITPYEWLK